jgi:hypothetical protein
LQSNKSFIRYANNFAGNLFAPLTFLETYTLAEAYEQWQQKGKLKEIAAELGEDSNPVIMSVKHKKSYFSIP